MKVGDLVRTLRWRSAASQGASEGDVILLLENLGERKYHDDPPGILFRGMLTSFPEETDYLVFEHDAEVINESR